MGVVSNLRGLRTGTTQESLPVSNGVSSASKKKWFNFMPLFVGLVVIAEIGFLGRLDMAKNAAVVDSWAHLFYKPSEVIEGSDDDLGIGVLGGDLNSESESCEEWLEREDAVTYSRDFKKEPISVVGADEEWKSCSVGCQFGFDASKKHDATFGSASQAGTSLVLRSMESSQYYAENNIAMARRRGVNIVMTTSLSSDVPVGYFSWAEYDIMAPVQPKTENALAAANRDGRVDKVEALKRYKFSLAFENSNEEDYVTEKFFQSLVAGTVPVVVGAPNIQDFAPSPSSILHIQELTDVESVAKTMRYLAENPEAYNQSLRWKYEGPSDSFKALVDMAAVHSSCRLCIHLATMIREKEEKSPSFKKRSCKCTKGSETVYHLYIRERGRFEMESIFLRSSNLTLEALKSCSPFEVHLAESRTHLEDGKT
ncbi:glycoprotein 3-alpha-L-fucosyltransferase A [Quillaja saponaria]|uniref:Fucosyltransferase n=1 Tax=Quillaja saponaria TaxID=32244 RepID=A0AAD7M007_QUISA|nr:glycoprotein 3-alpha-L-fucosyltransferase A [Quillaja saponaria]